MRPLCRLKTLKVQQLEHRQTPAAMSVITKGMPIACMSCTSSGVMSAEKSIFPLSAAAAPPFFSCFCRLSFDTSWRVPGLVLRFLRCRSYTKHLVLFVIHPPFSLSNAIWIAIATVLIVCLFLSYLHRVDVAVASLVRVNDRKRDVPLPVGVVGVPRILQTNPFDDYIVLDPWVNVAVFPPSLLLRW